MLGLHRSALEGIRREQSKQKNNENKRTEKKQLDATVEYARE